MYSYYKDKLYRSEHLEIQREFSGVIELFYTLTEVMVTQTYTCMEIYRTVGILQKSILFMITQKVKEEKKTVRILCLTI